MKSTIIIVINKDKNEEEEFETMADAGRRILEISEGGDSVYYYKEIKIM